MTQISRRALRCSLKWLLPASLAALASAQTPTLLGPTVTQVAAGYSHTCALTSVGAVQCWGDNSSGQLGNNSTTDSPVPVEVTGLSGGVAVIAVGSGHTCALTKTGAVQCWGWNIYGKLGNNSTADSLVPVVVTGLAGGVVAIVAGGFHTCALTTAGAVLCWGYNGYGGLGNNSTTNSSVPVAVTGLASGVAAITAGNIHTCALTTSGAVQCWGDNLYGQLGNNSTLSSPVPVAVTSLGGGVAVIEAGNGNTCALTTAGAVQCWGHNNAGQLGTNSTMTSLVPVAVTGLASGVTAVTTGGSHTCALTASGAVRCWGNNYYGQLGNSSILDSLVPITVTGLASGVAAITTGANHTCALSTAGAVQCWGRNGNGQLGNDSATDSLVPVAVTGVASRVAAIRAGGFHTCALTTAGAVKCTGDNFYGQLGDNSTTSSRVHVAVTGLASGVVAMAAGANHTCVLTAVGAVQCWGFNISGQLGNNSSTNSVVPVAVAGLSSGVTAITAGAYHTCALTTSGAVQCWGLSNNSTAGSYVPVTVTGLSSPVAAIAAGYTHTCALTKAGAVLCWGRNRNGELGDNSMMDSPVPVAVTGLASGVAAITAGSHHNCALTAVETLQCWGSNFYGQLGNNSTTNSLVPVEVTGPVSGLAAITAGDAHTCALIAVGGVRCWGYNGPGNLGNNSTVDSPVPVVVTGLTSPVATITAGAYHNCALTTAGTIQCWGQNGNGQFGNNSTANPGGTISILAGQSLMFAPVTSMAAGSALNLSATATGGGYEAFVYDTWTPGTCTISGITLTATSTGLCGVRASRAGGSDLANGTIATAPQQLRLISITGTAAQSISFTTITPFSWYQGAATLAATTSSGLTVAYSVSTGTCSIIGTILTAFAPGTCVITANQSGNATFTAAAQQSQSATVNVGPALLDIDASGAPTKYDAATEGLMVMRFLLGYQGNAITDNATSPTPGRTPAQMLTHLAGILPLLDVDGDGSARATSDGLLILRYLLGLRGAALLVGASVGPATALQVETAIERLMPP